MSHVSELRTPTAIFIPRWYMSKEGDGGMILTKKTRRNRRKLNTSDSSNTTNTTWNNTGLRRESRPLTAWVIARPRTAYCIVFIKTNWRKECFLQFIFLYAYCVIQFPRSFTKNRAYNYNQAVDTLTLPTLNRRPQFRKHRLFILTCNTAPIQHILYAYHGVPLRHI